MTIVNIDVKAVSGVIFAFGTVTIVIYGYYSSITVPPIEAFSSLFPEPAVYALSFSSTLLANFVSSASKFGIYMFSTCSNIFFVFSTRL